MSEIVIAFITGLTTGGLSCMAVQGGLLASSMAQQIETEIRTSQVKKNQAAPILWFLGAKLIAYTALGFLLGALGSLISLTPTARGIFQVAIGIFMVGQALRLLNVHPIFRFFSLEPPYFLRKFIRNKARAGSSYFSAAFLGALTIFIPCGITQAMLAIVVASGDAVQGALIMFAFTLGTSPVFFLLSYLATKLGSRLEKYFSRLVAGIVLILAFFTIQTGVTLLGWRGFQPQQVAVKTGTSSLPSTVIATAQAYQPPETENLFTENPQKSENIAFTEASLEVVNTGYEPEVLKVPGGRPIRLTIQSNKVYSCSLALVFPTENIEVMMQPTDEQVIELPAYSSGDTIPFTCSMGMFTGEIQVE